MSKEPANFMKRKLTDEQVREIRRSKRTTKELAYDYKVSCPTITRIRNGKRRSNVSVN
jgi:hypothetical protein